MLREKIKSEALKQGFRHENGKINYYRLAQASRVTITPLTKYIEGKSDLMGASIEKILEALNIVI